MAIHTTRELNESVLSTLSAIQMVFGSNTPDMSDPAGATGEELAWSYSNLAPEGCSRRGGEKTEMRASVGGEAADLS